MYNVLELLKLADMLRQIRVESYSTNELKDKLKFIADKIDDYVNSIGGELNE